MRDVTVVIVGGEIADSVLPHLVTDYASKKRERCFCEMGEGMWSGRISMLDGSGFSANVYLVKVEDVSEAAALDADFLVVDAKQPIKERRIRIELPPRGKPLPGCQRLELHGRAKHNALSVAHALVAVILGYDVTLTQPVAKEPRPWESKRRRRGPMPLAAL